MTFERAISLLVALSPFLVGLLGIVVAIVSRTNPKGPEPPAPQIGVPVVDDDHADAALAAKDELIRELRAQLKDLRTRHKTQPGD